MLSLRHFRLARWWCSLSLGGWSPKNPARRSKTCSGRLGGAAAAGPTMVRSPAAPDSFSVIFRFGADAGARAIGATDGAAAVELRGLRQQPDRNRTYSGGDGCGVLSLRHFRLARWWCSLSLGGWSPKNPARRSKTCSGRLGGAAAAGPTMVRSPAAPDSFSVIFRFGADAGARAIGATDGAAAVELRGLRQQPDRNRTYSGGDGCGVLSLRHFRLARWWCSLSLGGWSPKNPARRSKTCSGRLGGAAAAGPTMVRSPAAPDSFSVIFRFGADAGARAIGATDGAAAVELRGLRQQPDRNRTYSGGDGCGVLSLRHFRLARWWCSLSLGGWSPKNPARRSKTCSGRLGGAAAAGPTMVRSPAAPDSFSVIFRFGADAGARAIGATDGAAAVELRGLRQQPDRNRTYSGGDGCGVLSLRHFRLARWWCSLSLGGWSPKNPARRSKTCSGRLGGAAAAGPTMVRSPAAPDSFSVIFRFGADAGARAIGATDGAAAVELRGLRQQPDRNRTYSGGDGCGVLSLRHFRLARWWCSLSLGGWSPKNPARRSKQ